MVNFIFSIFRKISITHVMVLMLLGSTGTIYIMQKKISNLRKENERVTTNFMNVNQEIGVVRNKNGELSNTVNQLNLTVSELKEYSAQTADELNNMRVKLKNVQNITHFQTRTVYRVDTVHVKDSLNGNFEIKNDWITNTFKIVQDSIKQYVTDYSLSVRDSIITVSEVQYKRFWIFWKRPIGVKLHIKSFNPYSNFEKIESIQISK